MKIRKTTEKDLSRLMEIYDYARKFMADHGNPHQWAAACWPPEQLILDDIRAGKSYVCVNDDGRVVGTFFYDYGHDIDPDYRTMEDGAWHDDSSFGVIHRIAADGSEKGIGTFCLNWAYEQSGHLKIDTHEDNIVMQNLLSELGFEKRGVIRIRRNNEPRLAYEKYPV